MSDSVEIITVNSENIKQEVVVKYMQSYLRSFYNADCYKWQYLNKNNDGGLFFLKTKDEIISSQGMIPIDLNYKNNKIKSAKSESSFLNEAYRGKKLFEKLYFETIKHCEDRRINFFWGFTLLAKVWKSKLEFEVEDVFFESKLLISYKSSVKDFIVNSSSRDFKERCKSLIKSTFMRSKSPFQNFSKAQLEVKLINLEEIDQYKSITNLYNKWKKLNPNYISIDLEDDKFLKWRIIENPCLNYKVLVIQNQNEEIGFAIINIIKDTIYLVDLMIPDNKRIRGVITSLFNYFNKNYEKAYVAYLGNIRNKYSQFIFNELNLLGSQTNLIEEMKFVYKITDEVNSKINVDSFYLNGLWTEGFKI